MKGLMMTKNVLLTLLASAVSLLTPGCKDDEPIQPHVSSVQLSVEDASCTEAWLKVSLSDTNEPRTVVILQDGQRVTVSRLPSPDSVFVVEGLLPRHTYSFVVQRLRDSTVIDASSSAQATTMDTTSHDFFWHMDTLGVTSSVLYDVAIVNDTLAYAVGEIYLMDSTGQFDPILYNVAVWNGQSWIFLRAPYFYQGQPFYNPIRAVFAFSASHIWFGIGNLIHWNGQTYVPVDISSVWGPNRINKIWGSSSHGVTIVGDNGSIAHYNGIWSRIESGTTVTLNDVWGGTNRWVGDDVVLVAAGNKYTAGETKLLRISSVGIVDTLPWSIPIRTRQSIWFGQQVKAFTCGSGVFSNTGSGWQQAVGIPAIYTNSIRGNGDNDLWVVGDFGLAAHFNGFSWRDFPETRLAGNYESVAVRSNLMIAVGWIGSRAVILCGKRQ